MRSKLIFAVVVLIVTISSIGYIARVNVSKGEKMTGLSLVLSLDKTKYQSDEPIHASMTLKNTGDKDIVVRKRMAPSLPYAPNEIREVTFTIQGPSGQITPVFTIQVGLLTPEDFVALSPGETIENTINIQRLYHLTDIGTYSMSAVYQNIMDPGLFRKEAWKGEITSNLVVFEIVP